MNLHSILNGQNITTLTIVFSKLKNVLNIVCLEYCLQMMFTPLKSTSILITIVTIKYLITNNSLWILRMSLMYEAQKNQLSTNLLDLPPFLLLFALSYLLVHSVFKFFRSFFIVLAFHALICDYLSTVPALLVFY